MIAVLAAKVARRTLLIGLMCLFAVGNGLSALAPTYGWMLAFRFLAGVPHGAYFGVAALVAAFARSRERRFAGRLARASGLTIATVVGVPLANGIGHSWGGAGASASWLCSPCSPPSSYAFMRRSENRRRGRAPYASSCLETRAGVADPGHRGDRLRRIVLGLHLPCLHAAGVT